MFVMAAIYVIGLGICIALAIHSLVMADLADRGKSREWREYLKKGGEDV